MVILIPFILVRRDFPRALHDSAAKTLTIRIDQAIQSGLLTEVTKRKGDQMSESLKLNKLHRLLPN